MSEGGMNLSQHEMLSDFGFRGRYLNILRLMVVLVIVFVLAIHIFYHLRGHRPEIDQLRLNLRPTTSGGQSLLARHQNLIWFLHNFGTYAEEALYLDCSTSLVLSALNTELLPLSGTAGGYTSRDKNNVVLESNSYIQTIYYALIKFQIQVIFVIVITWRVFLLSFIGGVIVGIMRFEVYRGGDLLGILGNGRLFFSGLRVRLNNVAGDGAPDLMVPGLACLRQASGSDVNASPFPTMLREYGAWSQTVEKLVAIVLSDQDFPAYVSPAQAVGVEVRDLVDRCVVRYDVTLVEHTYYILDRVLALHALYREVLVDEGRAEGLSEQERLSRLNITLDLDCDGCDISKCERLEAIDYSEYFVSALHRCLTPRMRDAFVLWEPLEVALLVLALQAGKHLTYRRETNGDWGIVSMFPELNARAVLHSIPDYGNECNYVSRKMLRRSIIYSTRSNVLDMNRLAIDLEDGAISGRQLGELLLAQPQNLPMLSDEVELFGLARESYRYWKEELFRAWDDVADKSLRQSSILNPSGEVLFLPVRQVLKLATRSIDMSVIRRMGELSEEVAKYCKSLRTREGLESMPIHLQIVPGLIDASEGERIKNEHQLSAKEMANWLALRYMLRNYSVIGQRIGDKANGPSQLLHLSYFKGPYANRQLMVCRGVVPLRTNIFSDNLDETVWKEHVVQITNVDVFNDRKEYSEFVVKNDCDIEYHPCFL